MPGWLLFYLYVGGLGVAEDKPKLTIDAPRLVTIKAGLAGQGARKRIELTARLEGELAPESAKSYYCLAEEWFWDDGSYSRQEPDCDPFTPGTEIKREWRESHYFGQGQFFVTFTLMDGDEMVAEAVHELRVYGSAVLRR